jgi:hypothetical protein
MRGFGCACTLTTTWLVTKLVSLSTMNTSTYQKRPAAKQTIVMTPRTIPTTPPVGTTGLRDVWRASPPSTVGDDVREVTLVIGVVDGSTPVPVVVIALLARLSRDVFASAGSLWPGVNT